MRVTTKKGDEGYTDVIGDRLLKCDDRIEAYGSIDELNTQVGLLHFYIQDSVIKEQLETIMDINRKICSDLALVNESRPFKITIEDVELIESYNQYLNDKIENLLLFQRPIGAQPFHQANIVRAITRRCERRIVRLAQDNSINHNVLALINRMSDYFFLLSKVLN